MTSPSNYPAGAENDPRAPYNQEELDLVCDECGAESPCIDDAVGDQCCEWFNQVGRPCTDEDPGAEQCPGRFKLARCEECGHAQCCCD